MRPHDWKLGKLVSGDIYWCRCERCGSEITTDCMPPIVRNWRDLSDDCDETIVSGVQDD